MKVFSHFIKSYLQLNQFFFILALGLLEGLRISEKESAHTEEISWFNKMGTERLLVFI